MFSCIVSAQVLSMSMQQCFLMLLGPIVGGLTPPGDGGYVKAGHALKTAVELWCHHRWSFRRFS
jgi:hypothetical protein